MDRLAAFIAGEGNWLPIAMTIAMVAVAAVWARHSSLAARRRVQEAVNLFVGMTLVVMSTGHLLAVTTRLLQGTLAASPALLYPIGIAILVPAVMLVRHAGETANAYNAWLAATLTVLGLINIPLAIPALLNIAYSRHTRPRTGQLILGAWVVVTLGLFAGGLIFMLSGARTFEEFSNR